MTEQDHTKDFRQGWNEAIAEVLKLLQRDPPSRVGEANFTQRVRNLQKEQK